MERAAPVLGSHTQGADAKLWAPYYLIVVFRWPIFAVPTEMPDGVSLCSPVDWIK